MRNELSFYKKIGTPTLDCYRRFQICCISSMMESRDQKRAIPDLGMGPTRGFLTIIREDNMVMAFVSWFSAISCCSHFICLLFVFVDFFCVVVLDVIASR